MWAVFVLVALYIRISTIQNFTARDQILTGKADPHGLGGCIAKAALAEVGKTPVSYASAPNAPRRVLIVQDTVVFVPPVPSKDPFVLEILVQFRNELGALDVQQ